MATAAERRAAAPPRAASAGRDPSITRVSTDEMPDIAARNNAPTR